VQTKCDVCSTAINILWQFRAPSHNANSGVQYDETWQLKWRSNDFYYVCSWYKYEQRALPKPTSRCESTTTDNEGPPLSSVCVRALPRR